MRAFTFCLAVLLLIGCASRNPVDSRAVVNAVAAPTEPGFHLHLPGIGGYRSVDRFMLRGLVEGGFTSTIHPYDWTGTDAGLAALVATRRHRDEAGKIAAIIVKQAREHPRARITVTTHSAGAGIITWALEQLPPDVQIDTLVLLAPALSPAYDLSRALRHVRGKVYAFTSPYDVAVLGIGTKMFGTVDGIKAEAAGMAGFVRPERGDEQQYAKLVQIPYQSAWIKLGNIGDHIGTLNRPFSRDVLAPLLVSGTLPTIKSQEPIKLPPPPGAATIPATRPATAESVR
jgi:hypothetical protein